MLFRSGLCISPWGLASSDWPTPGGSHLNILLLVGTSTRGQQVEGRGRPNGSMSALGKSSCQGGVLSNGGCEGASQLSGKDESLSD